jgi:hypothetical protein
VYTLADDFTEQGDSRVSVHSNISKGPLLLETNRTDRPRRRDLFSWPKTEPARRENTLLECWREESPFLAQWNLLGVYGAPLPGKARLPPSIVGTVLVFLCSPVVRDQLYIVHRLD